MRNIEITKREIIIAIIIFIGVSAIGLLITDGIHDKTMVDNDKYFKSLKIDNDKHTFDYAIETQVGNILAYGEASTVDPVEVEGLKGKYYSVERETERYTQHTRSVSYKCGRSTCHRTETYWTWDTIATDNFMAKKIKFLGNEYSTKDVNIENDRYNSTESAGFHLRYKFYTTPVKVKGSLYAHTTDGKLKDAKFHHDQKIKELMGDKEGEADKNSHIFLAIWEFIALLLAVGYTLLDNRYINGR